MLTWSISNANGLSCDPGQAAVTVYINTWLFADVCRSNPARP